jgi:hypothetical protein
VIHDGSSSYVISRTAFCRAPNQLNLKYQILLKLYMLFWRQKHEIVGYIPCITFSEEFLPCHLETKNANKSSGFVTV